MNEERKHGFTIAELLIVVAIIAVLVAIAIPVFRSQLERARRATDIANARSIASELVALANSGDIEIPENNAQEGAWVLVTKEGVRPGSYVKSNTTTFFGANPNVIISGQKHNANWNVQDTNLQKLMNEFSDLKVYSDGYDTTLDGIGGWDWYVVQIYYNNSKDTYDWIIYSGKNNTDGSIAKRHPNPSYIEQWMSRG